MTVVAVLAAALTLGATVAPDAARASTVTVTSAGRDGDDEASTKATTTAVGSGAGSKEGSKEESGSKESKGSFVLPDAGRGSGASCPATLNEDRKPPVDVNAVTTFTTSTPIFTSNFDAGTAAGFKQISGHWLVKDETYTQQDTCGFDYTALFTTRAVEHYRYSVTFHAKAANPGLHRVQPVERHDPFGRIGRRPHEGRHGAALGSLRQRRLLPQRRFDADRRSRRRRSGDHHRGGARHERGDHVQMAGPSPR